MKACMIVPLFTLALSPLVASASPGALEINQDCIAVGCFAGDTPGYPVTITQPGSYVFTSDVATPPNTTQPVIDVEASPVDIDLNYHTIDGGGSCTGTPVTSCTGFSGGRGLAFSNNGNPGVFHVHDGTVRGFGGSGISMFDSGDGTLLERLTVTQNQYGAGIITTSDLTTTRIRDSQFVRNLQVGLFVSNGQNRLLIENCSVVGNSADGIQVGTGSVVVGNRISSNGGLGLHAYGASATCAMGQNVFSGNNGGGGAVQYQIQTVRDMGGNVCLEKATCP